MHQERDLLICVTEDTLGPLGEIHPVLQHVTRSRGWNITERVNSNVGNEIELGIEIPMIKSWILQVSQKQKE
jgi:hypothetical protein